MSFKTKVSTSSSKFSHRWPQMFQLAKKGSVILYTADTAEGLLRSSQTVIEPIIEFLSLAAIDKSSVFYGNTWPKKHVSTHGKMFPNTSYDAVVFAVSLANHAPYIKLPPQKAQELCAHRLVHIVKRGAGERSADVPLRTSLALYVEKGHIVETGIKRSFTSMDQSTTPMESERNPTTTDTRTGTNKQQKIVYRTHLHGDSPPVLIFVVHESNTGQPKE